MHIPANSSDNSEPQFLARLDSQDTRLSQSIREYLTSFGLAVVENHPNRISVHYHIICGDSDYVKTILSNFAERGSRALVISWDSSAKTYPKDRDVHVRRVLIDRRLLSPKDLETIFRFFFTSSDQTLDMRAMVNREDAGKEGADKKRIADLMDDIFRKEFKAGKTEERHNQKTSIVGMRLIFALVILPIFWYFATLGTSISAYFLSARFLAKGDHKASIKSAFVGRASARAGGLLVRAATAPFFSTTSPRILASQERLFWVLEQIGLALTKTGNLLSEAKLLGASILSPQDLSTNQHPAVWVDRIQTQVDALVSDIGRIQAEIDSLEAQGDFPISLIRLGNVDVSLRDRIARAKRLLTSADQLLLLYKEAGGFNETKEYLVLFQNSLEIRPTGGFIGSVGRLTASEGKLSQFTVNDVYELDGQLRGHVDPPEVIRTLLGSEHWYLRDSNWDPNFEVSGEKARWFYEKETGQSVDGVIAITTPLIVKLLGVTGPIVLTDYNDQISADNFLGKALYYTKSDFFPGSTQKKDFLGSLSRAMIERFMSGTEFTIASVAPLIGSLESRDVQLYFYNSKLEQFVKQYGWAGTLVNENACRDTAEIPCRNLRVAIIDANIGVNKLNSFLTHELSREVHIDQSGLLRETIVFTQNNTAGRETIDGMYKSYLRFYLPMDGIVDEILIDGVPIPVRNQQTEAQELPYWEKILESGVPVVGVAGIIPPAQTRRVSIIYHMPAIVEGRTKLVLAIRAQPGAPTTPVSVRLYTPASWETQLEGEPVASGGAFEYNRVLSADIDDTLVLTPQ